MTDRNHTRRTRDGRAQTRRVAIWGVVLVPLFAVALLGSNAMNGLMFVVLSGLALAFFSLPANRIAGYQAEERIVARLARELPNDYVLFNQLEIPNPKSRTGFTEIDVVVIGPTGLHTLEVKDNRGEIFCRNDRSNVWRVKKTGRRGGSYYTTMRNPVRQAMSQALALRDYLGGYELEVWVNPKIVATNAHSRWCGANALDIKVVSGRGSGLLRAIVDEPTDSPCSREDVNAIESLLLTLDSRPNPAIGEASE